MRLTIPEANIKLYDQGFDEHDKLGRKDTGEKLSNLVEHIDDPLVIALDGAWGSGKSHFLKCWVGEHLKRDRNTTQTVYFDAFQHDFLDDPLIALTGAISERLEQEPKSTSAKAWQTAKNAAPFLGKAALRLGTAALVGKAISLTDDSDGELNDIGDKMAEEGGDISKALTQFWKKEDGKRAAVQAFRAALTKLTEPNTDGKPTRKLVIVIDELDRCRPDYALSLLEIIKHFFNVDGVHFLLGVNLKELQNSVRARYGRSINATTYLQKFITLTIDIEVRSSSAGPQPTWQKHFRYCQKRMSFPRETGPFLDRIREHLEWMRTDRSVTLRDVERTLTAIAASPSLSNELSAGHSIVLAALTVLKVLNPSAYRQLRALERPSPWLLYFDLEGQSERISERLTLIEAYIVDQSQLTPKQAQLGFELFGYTEISANNVLLELSDNYLEDFDLSQF